eukprot:9479149-Pyramimonas_sp.AAC.1
MTAHHGMAAATARASGDREAPVSQSHSYQSARCHIRPYNRVGDQYKCSVSDLAIRPGAS